MYTVRPATREDAIRISRRLRLEDSREIRSASGKEPIEVLPDCADGSFILLYSDYYTGVNLMLAMFGVTRVTSSAVGVPWMVATPLLVHHQVYFLRNCKAWIAKLSEGYTHLINCVDARNELHIKWLKWCGFTFTH